MCKEFTKYIVKAAAAFFKDVTKSIVMETKLQRQTLLHQLSMLHTSQLWFHKPGLK